ncbi:hypothetical protein WJX77_009222 [Trebouxia sp. C0004]
MKQCTPNRPSAGAPRQLQLQSCHKIQNSLTEPFALRRKATSSLAAAPVPAALRLQKACKKLRQLPTCGVQRRRAYSSRGPGLFLCASGHNNWQHSPKWTSNPGHMPVWQPQTPFPTPPNSSSAADDYLSGSPGSSSASQDSTEALTRAAEMSHAIQSSLSGSQQAGTSRDMDYEDLLNSDYGVTDDVDCTVKEAQFGDNPVSKRTYRHTEPTFLQAAGDSTHRNGAKAGHSTRVTALKQRAEHAAQATVDWIAAYILPVTAVVVLAFLIWKSGFIELLRSLTQMHTWVMVAGTAVLLLVTPQTVKANTLLRMLNDMSLFANYGQAKRALGITTWSTIAVFFVLVFCAGFG